MADTAKKPLWRALDHPFTVAAIITGTYYWFINQEGMRGSLLHRYTTEHVVEYVIVGFFIWGIADALFRVLSFPREIAALRQNWLPPRKGREPVAHAAQLTALIDAKPLWLRESRIGRRLSQALQYVEDGGSTAEFDNHLRHLSIQDEDRTYANFGLIRFIAWVTPVLGFLGTVVHFGTALGGFSVEEISEKLPHVVAEIGTAFDTTTSALAAATTMMFCLFLSERTEKAIVHTVDRRTEDLLSNRFETADKNIAPFLAALEASNRVTLGALDAVVERQLNIWTGAFGALHEQAEALQHRHTEHWTASLAKLEDRYEAGDAERERRLTKVIESLDKKREQHQAHVQATAEQMAALHNDFSQLVAGLSAVSADSGRLTEMQASLAENLRVLRETQKIDDAVHNLTAAIHLLTARHGRPASDKKAA